MVLPCLVLPWLILADDSEHFDLVVIGGGPAGTSGAIAGGLLGKRVALVEKAEQVGGAGINTGTIPSKTLRETSLMLSGWRSRRSAGRGPLAAARGHRARLHAPRGPGDGGERDLRGDAARPATRRDPLPRARRASSIRTRCGSTVRTEARALLRGEKILIATGSSPVRPPEFAFDDDRVHDSDEILAAQGVAEEARRDRRRRDRRGIRRHVRRAGRRGASWSTAATR